MNLEKAKPAVPVTINGEEKRLLFDWWAFSVIDEEKGSGFWSTLGDMSMSKVIFLAWAGLIHDHPFLDGASKETRRAGQRTVAEWLNSGTDIGELAQAITQAVTNSEPLKALKKVAPKNAEPEAEKIAEGSTGSAS